MRVGESCMRVDESWWELVKVNESCESCMRVDESLLELVKIDEGLLELMKARVDKSLLEP